MLAPHSESRIDVIEGGDGPARIIREGGSAGNVRVERIVKDGNVIRIEEVETDKDQKEVKVKVEAKDEKTGPEEKKK